MRQHLDDAERDFVVRDVMEALLQQVEEASWKDREAELQRRLEEENKRRYALQVECTDLRVRHQATVHEARVLRPDVERELWKVVQELEQKARCVGLMDRNGD